MKAFMMVVPLLGICQILGFAIAIDRVIFGYLYVIINGCLVSITKYIHMHRTEWNTFQFIIINIVGVHLTREESAFHSYSARYT